LCAGRLRCDTGVAVICDDGMPCNGLESCNSDSGECQSGDAIVCDDGNPCNGIESCLPESGDCHAGTPAPCSDSNPCNGEESCNTDTGECIPGEPTVCDDNDACNGLESCDTETGDCQAGDAMNCDDKVACTQDSCVDGLCINDASAAGCDDGKPCTQDACTGTGCTHTDKDCDDGKLCTTDSCVASTGKCLHTAIKCDDGKPCNGVETCDPALGECKNGEPIACSDGNPCNGIESCQANTGQCKGGTAIKCSNNDMCDGTEICNPNNGGCITPVAPLCPQAPSKCGQSGAFQTPTKNKITNAGNLGFRLSDDDTWSEYSAIWTKIENNSATTKAPLSVIMGDLNRTGSKKSYTLIDCFHSAFYWNNGDNKVGYWMPQGVTGSADSNQSGNGFSGGKFNGKKIMLVSWYHNAEKDSSTSLYKGVRISFVDHSGSIPKYRHALLVEPSSSAAGPTFHALASSSSSLHAGGIVWYKNYLYVVDTSHGLRVFDLNRILSVSTGKSKTVGYDIASKKYHAFNYKYVIPQVGSYSLCGGANCCARFSFVSADLSTSPPSLLTGEYTSNEINGRLMRWPLTSSGRLKVIDGGVQCSQTLFTGVKKMQGAASYSGHYYISSSVTESIVPTVMDTLYYGLSGGAVKSNEYPYGPEDLYYSKWSGLLWTCTEHPATTANKKRFCMSVNAFDVKTGCK